jgi:micrococcal nuclease
MQRERLALVLLLMSVFMINYPLVNSFLEDSFQNPNVGFVERVVDGDTAIISNHSVRFLGINSPEKGEIGHDAAMDFLKSKIEKKNVTLVFGKDRMDLYGRELAYVFFNNENVNLESVKLGYSNVYFPNGKDPYYGNFADAWQDCLEKGMNLCNRSNDTCLSVEKWDTRNQVVILKNTCNYDLNITGWSVKDEGRKNYRFSDKSLLAGEEVSLVPSDWGKDYVWTETGDSIFVRDNFGKLVYWNTY